MTTMIALLAHYVESLVIHMTSHISHIASHISHIATNRTCLAIGYKLEWPTYSLTLLRLGL